MSDPRSTPVIEAPRTEEPARVPAAPARASLSAQDNELMSHLLLSPGRAYTVTTTSGRVLTGTLRPVRSLRTREHGQLVFRDVVMLMEHPDESTEFLHWDKVETFNRGLLRAGSGPTDI